MLDLNDIKLPDNQELVMKMLTHYDPNDKETEGYSYSSSVRITPVELAIINQFFYDAYSKESIEGMEILSYGHIGMEGRLMYGGIFDHSGGWWFRLKLVGLDNAFFIQTLAYMDKYDTLNTQFSITSDVKMSRSTYTDMFKNLKAIAFNNSEFRGTCIEVVIFGGSFKGINKVPVEDVCHNIILNPSQKRLIKHLTSRLKRGKSTRVMFNGVPGSGKTESIRQLIETLTPQCTFIIPQFNSVHDLKMILETCEVFDNGIVIMDDIDLFIGSREKGNTTLLGEFLAFFDGVQKRSISLLASTNDKGLVDEAAERPGRFNFIVDFDYLTDEQVVEICNIHLDEEWRVPEVYEKLTGKIDGQQVKITGAFIHNLGENLNEMKLDYEDDEITWELQDTLTLIESFYKGFYGSQTKERRGLGYQTSK